MENPAETNLSGLGFEEVPFSEAIPLLRSLERNIERITDMDISSLPRGSELNRVVRERHLALETLHGMLLVVRPIVAEQMGLEAEAFLTSLDP